MPIPTEHFNNVVFLSEIELNCKIIQHTANRLEDSAKHWINMSNSIDDGIKITPVEIVIDCIACLSTAAFISKMLFAGKRSNANIRDRCAKLNDLLNSPPLPNIQNVYVRNSWEHLDERLDTIIKSGLTSYSEIHVSPKTPSIKTVVARYFDPTTLEIKFLEDKFSIRHIAAEANLLIEQIRIAFNSMHK